MELFIEKNLWQFFDKKENGMKVFICPKCGKKIFIMHEDNFRTFNYCNICGNKNIFYDGEKERDSEEVFREHMRINQYHIPKRLNYLARYYPEIPWFSAQRLYTAIVEKYLTIFQVEIITDIPFGRGFVLVRNEFEESLKKIEKERKKGMEE